MAAKRSNEKKKRGFLRWALRLSLVGASVYLAVSFVSGQLQVSAKRQQLQSLEGQVQHQADVNQELQRLMDSGDEDAYVERMAREKLNYARPEEKVFIDITGE